MALSTARVRRRRLENAVFVSFCVLVTAVALTALVLILVSLVGQGAGGLNADVFTKSTPAAGTPGGLINAIVGSILMCALGMVLALVIGVMAGTWLAEYAGEGHYGHVVRYLNDVLLSAPSILMGLFVYEILVAPFRGFSGFAGAVALALLAVPVITRTTEDVLKLQPTSLREAAVALGSPFWHVVRAVLWRSATSGILTGALPDPLHGPQSARLGGSLDHRRVGARRHHYRPICLQGIQAVMTDPAPEQRAPEIAALQPIAAEREPPPPGDMSVIAIEADRTKIDIQNLGFFYGKSQALKAVPMSVALNAVTAMIGPSGCGKSTLLRTLNRMYGLYPGQRATGRIMFDGEDILGSGVNLSLLRARIGMVFQKPTPFPMSIHDNVAFGVRLYESLSHADMHNRVEDSLRRAALWDEVKDKLHSSGLGLSGGQQQRLCVARCIAVRPEVLLLDEPTSALDPISSAKLEETITQLKSDYTIVIVTHNLGQAARLSDYTGFMYLGELVEFGETGSMFTKPVTVRASDYITGRFG